MSSAAPRSCRSLLLLVALLGAACLVGFWLGSQRRAETLSAHRNGDDDARLLSRLPTIDVTAAASAQQKQQQQQQQLHSSGAASASSMASSLLSSIFLPKSSSDKDATSAAAAAAAPPAVATPAPPRTLYLAIGILSDRRLTSRRMRTAARATWLFPLFHADVKSTRVRHWFLIGTKDANAAQMRELEAEQEFFGDLLLLPLLDSCMFGFRISRFCVV
jgi:hypothetical protein